MKTTRKQQAAIADWIVTARANGLRNLWAALPTAHPLMRGPQRPGQIRVVKEHIAQGWDELGNRVVLTPDLAIIQFIGDDDRNALWSTL